MKWVTHNAIQGVNIKGYNPLTSAKALADEYLVDKSYKTHDDRVDALINWETSKNFTSGFITGLGGIMVMPISIPAAFGASWVIQARMAAAIAYIYGHKLESDRVRTLILISLLGDAAKDVLKSAGIIVSTKLSAQLISQISGKTLIEINKRVGFRLITKAGEKGVFNMIKLVPLAGGIVGGVFDATACQAVGRVARHLFRRAGGNSQRKKRKTPPKKVDPVVGAKKIKGRVVSTKKASHSKTKTPPKN